MYRQGDVLIIPVKNFPEQCEPVARENGQVVLAHGEATGHAHVITDSRTTLFRDQKLNALFMKTDGDFSGPLAADLIDVNQEQGWFLAQTTLRRRPVKFSFSHASIENGVIECGPFALLDHDEHDPQAIPNGEHEVRRQREYTPGAIRNVAD